MKPPRSSSHTHGRLPQQLHRRAASSDADRRRIPFERWLYGRHAVAAALNNPERRWYRLAVLTGQEQEAGTLIATAAAARRGNDEPIRVLDRGDFAALLPEGAVHQGLALAVEPLAEPDLEDVLRRAAILSGRSVVVVLDQVSDPRNVGAVLRSASAFGALAVVLPTAHRSSESAETVAR